MPLGWVGNGQAQAGPVWARGLKGGEAGRHEDS